VVTDDWDIAKEIATDSQTDDPEHCSQKIVHLEIKHLHLGDTGDKWGKSPD